jgi:DNA topoisomerase IB
MVEFGRALPVVRLLDTTALRVGNDEYARSNGSYGLTTVRNRHVTVNGLADRACRRCDIHRTLALLRRR